MEKQEELATQVVVQAQRLFYKKLVEGLSQDEINELNRRLAEEDHERVLGDEVTNAIFNYICPQTGTLSAVDGFGAHGNINDEGEIEAILTVSCKACGGEHPILAISFPKMLSMPLVDS